MSNRCPLIAAAVLGTVVAHQAHGQALPDVGFLDRLAA